MTLLVALLISLLDRLVPASDGVVLTSHPDLEDNVVALLRSEHARGHRVTVLAGDRTATKARAKALGLQVRIVKRNSISGIWAFVRSTSCVSTHGLFGSRPRRRGKRHLGLWHGEYIKAVGRVAGEGRVHQFDRMYVSGGLSRLIRSAETGVSPMQIEVTGVPRTDLLLSGGGAESRPRIIWAPTYRASGIIDKRLDGDDEAFQAFVHDAVSALAPLLEKHDAELWLRLHPSSASTIALDGARVRVADDAFLAAGGLTLYEALGSSRALVTDFSSLWVDYLHLDRPVIGAAPDLDSYAADRELLLQPYEWWFPGPVCRSVDELVGAVGAVLAGADDAAEHRRLVSSILLSSEASNPTEAVWRDLLGEV